MEVMDPEIWSTSTKYSTPRIVQVHAYFPPYNHNTIFSLQISISLFATPLQATEIRAEEGKSEDAKGDGEGSTAEKGVDAGHTGVRVAVCVLEDAGEDADDTGHAIFGFR
ncbi:hypothetical protein E4T43_00160 [Aureobasidium subglaciale]|nr:hypothetical protein E4T43_00160 [Aureobasidium subglaciale]